MSERRKILELFEKQRDYTESRINSGIELYRKGFGYITVKDKDGNPVKNVKIKAKQKNHEFRFGANLFMLDELETAEKNEIYKERFADVFNMATLPFYWDATEPEEGKTRYAKDAPKLYRRPPIDLCIEFCKKHGIEPREHALAYENFFPKWLYNATVPEVKKALEKRYAEISERYKDKIPTIEVTNEMLWQTQKTSFYNQNDYVSWCFKLAEKYFPANTLCINEAVLFAWDGVGNCNDQYYSYINSNIRQGARVDAIGMQYHMFFGAENEYDATRPYYNPEKLYKHMDLYAQFGKPLHITEITIPAYSWKEEDEEIQAEIIEKLYSIWFSHPNVEQIIYWNVVDGYAAFAPMGDMTAGENQYHGGLLRFDMTPKKANYTIKDLIQNKWHTETELAIADDGTACFKGFYGDYDLQIEADGKLIEKTVNLYSKGKNKFEIIL